MSSVPHIRSIGSKPSSIELYKSCTFMRSFPHIRSIESMRSSTELFKSCSLMSSFPHIRLIYKTQLSSTDPIRSSKAYACSSRDENCRYESFEGICGDKEVQKLFRRIPYPDSFESIDEITVLFLKTIGSVLITFENDSVYKTIRDLCYDKPESFKLSAIVPTLLFKEKELYKCEEIYSQMLRLTQDPEKLKRCDLIFKQALILRKNHPDHLCGFHSQPIYCLPLSALYTSLYEKLDRTTYPDFVFLSPKGRYQSALEYLESHKKIDDEEGAFRRDLPFRSDLLSLSMDLLDPKPFDSAFFYFTSNSCGVLSKKLKSSYADKEPKIFFKDLLIENLRSKFGLEIPDHILHKIDNLFEIVSDQQEGILNVIATPYGLIDSEDSPFYLSEPFGLPRLKYMGDLFDRIKRDPRDASIASFVENGKCIKIQGRLLRKSLTPNAGIKIFQLTSLSEEKKKVFDGIVDEITTELIAVKREEVLKFFC